MMKVNTDKTPKEPGFALLLSFRCVTHLYVQNTIQHFNGRR
jgi:hypothetical protein